MADDAFSKSIADFLTRLEARHYSPRTLDLYQRDLARLAELAGGRAPEQLNSHDIRRFLATLHARGQAPKSLARTLSAWRNFYLFLARDNQVSANPCVGLRPPKGEKRLPNALSPDEMAQLLNGTDGDPLALRDHAMFELMYSSGLRLSELVALDLGSLDLDSGEVRVRGKGSKDRIVPVGQQALAAVRAWLPQRKGLAKDTPALFVGARGERISTGVVGQRLKRLAVLHGVNQRVHPHALRHSFASHVLQSSGDLRAVQEMLGHASLSTTQVYTHLDFQHLAKVYDQAHPRAKKK